jgi:hypothetical protein
MLTARQPFSWSLGQAAPTQNQYSWTNISSMLYIEQPVGTGFSQGTPNIKVSLPCAAFLTTWTDEAVARRTRRTLRSSSSASSSSS